MEQKIIDKENQLAVADSSVFLFPYIGHIIYIRV
jgi:hypothetical protein